MLLTGNSFNNVVIAFPASNKYSGSAMIITMMMLLLVSILSLISAQSASLQQHMATNEEDRARAFQAAEKALRQAEAKIDALLDSSSGLASFGTTNGLYKGLEAVDGECVSYANWTSDQASWDDSDSIEVDVKNTSPFNQMGLATNPRYMVGLETETDQTSACYSSTVATGYSDSVSNSTATVEVVRFTITAIGYGKGPNTKVRLQETWSVSQ
ncbi:pilus assembly PilX family protein [Oceanobacter mangrovi]|uniref:pilus assembly PilX family protein n=1 Tax=Oceanobacter mangrovi TaxID=2862510 RepID=UPI001C8D84BD|nr:PilX N-terminal domain-containing pilus assembly protein [Oceanobacter mangrovi]